MGPPTEAWVRGTWCWIRNLTFRNLTTANRTNGVRLIQVQIRLVLLLKCDDRREIADGPLHGVDALDDDDDL